MNLFFETLNMRVDGTLTEVAKQHLLETLLSMPQFPSDRLPMDCDKNADYLWQRKDFDQRPVEIQCKSTYSGVDYLWMAGLLAGDESRFYVEPKLHSK